MLVNTLQNLHLPYISECYQRPSCYPYTVCIEVQIHLEKQLSRKRSGLLNDHSAQWTVWFLLPYFSGTGKASIYKAAWIKTRPFSLLEEFK